MITFREVILAVRRRQERMPGNQFLHFAVQQGLDGRGVDCSLDEDGNS